MEMLNIMGLVCVFNWALGLPLLWWPSDSWNMTICWMHRRGSVSLSCFAVLLLKVAQGRFWNQIQESDALEVVRQASSREGPAVTVGCYHHWAAVHMIPCIDTMYREPHPWPAHLPHVLRLRCSAGHGHAGHMSLIEHFSLRGSNLGNASRSGEPLVSAVTWVQNGHHLS